MNSHPSACCFKSEAPHYNQYSTAKVVFCWSLIWSRQSTHLHWWNVGLPRVILFYACSMWKIQQPNLICGVPYGYIRDTLSEPYAMFWHRDKQLCYRLPYSTALGWTVSLLHTRFESEAQQNDRNTATINRSLYWSLIRNQQSILLQWWNVVSARSI